MHYNLIKEMVDLIGLYDTSEPSGKPDVYNFSRWLFGHLADGGKPLFPDPDWQGKAEGRSADSVINTSLVRLYRYAKLQAKQAIAGTSFSTPDDFIYLISLVSFGSMTKTALIRLNVHEKSAGMQIVKRLLDAGLVEQTTGDADKRNRMLHITPAGKVMLEASMENIRQATRNVTEPLTHTEKMELIRLLTKLEDFHEAKIKER